MLTEEQLREIEARLEYVQRRGIGVLCTTAELLIQADVPSLLAEVRRLREENRQFWNALNSILNEAQYAIGLTEEDSNG